MFGSREDNKPLIEEIADIQDCDPREIRIGDIPVLATECAAIAYARRRDYPNIRRYVRQMHKRRRSRQRLDDYDSRWGRWAARDNSPQADTDEASQKTDSDDGFDPDEGAEAWFRRTQFEVID